MGLARLKLMVFFSVLLLCTIATAGELAPKKPLTGKRTIEDIWKVGEVRDYLFTINQIKVGHQWNKLVGVEGKKEQRVYRFEQKVSLDLSKIGQPVKIEQHATLVTKGHGAPLRYILEGSVNDQETKIKVEFKGKTANVTISTGRQEVHKKIPCPSDALLLDQNFVGSLNLLLGMSSHLKIGAEFSRPLFIPQALTVVPATVKITGKEKYRLGGKSIDAYVGNITPLQWIIWTSKDRRLLEIQIAAQGLTIRLKASE